MSLTVLWPPFHLCKFADIAFDARSSLSLSDDKEEGEGKGRRQRSSISGATLFLPPLSFPFRCGAIRLAHTRVPLPPYLSVVCLSMQGISDFNLPLHRYPSIPPCGFGLARWMTRFGPRAVSLPPILPLFSSPSLSRDTRFIESTGGGMRQTSEEREGRNALQTELTVQGKGVMQCRYCRIIGKLGIQS